MCFGGGSNNAGPRSEPAVPLSQLAPSRTPADQSRPSPLTGGIAERPTSTRRHQQPHTSSGRERPATSRRDRPESSSARERPATSRRDRPASTSAREGRTSRSSAGVDRHSAQPRSQIPSIQEQYTEDRTIIRREADLITLIDQHAEYYYLHERPMNQGIPFLDNPRTRQAAIRQHIAKTIINTIIRANRYEVAICESTLLN